MKKALIISPYFVPSNAPDMQRIRMSLPYFKEFGWEVEIVSCHPKYYETITDPILLKTIPSDTKIHHVSAFNKRLTSKLGLGSLALRSLWFYKKKVNQILKYKKFDLIYFSTTQFPVCILGPYWKRKFNIPFVIDLQDPWHTEYYRNRPKEEQPPKYWFSYRLNKWMEPLALKQCNGLISVSLQYIHDLHERYNQLKNVPFEIITFGFSEIDYAIAKHLNSAELETNKLKLKYIGVLGKMMNISLTSLFTAANEIPNFDKDFKLIFKGTSYDNNSNEKKAINIASRIGNFDIEEQSKRIGMINVLAELENSDGLIILGTDDPSYTASKIYPYIQSEKPILAILHTQSSAYHILNDITSATVIPIDASSIEMTNKLDLFLEQVKSKKKLVVDHEKFKNFSAKSLTQKQVELFEKSLAFKQVY
ncbi:MAG: hypothetical protein EOO43_14180 [Flavobacterium sp.]|nr:MAG: hypothetical protein EOO43_14180 [Flavobacterium sp.]